MNAVLTGVDYIRILPELVLSLFGILIMVIDPLLARDNDRRSLGTLGFVGTLCAIGATVLQANPAYQGTSFSGMIRVDGFSIFFHLIIIIVAAVVILASFEYLGTQHIYAGEYYALILFGAVGMCMMSAAVELVLIFISIEISSISTYVLAGLRRKVPASTESSIKYFLLGSFATAFFLYGVALMFGATGSTNVYTIGNVLRSGNIPGLAYIGIALMLVGLGFKVAAAPFHVWTPDVYEGAPSPVVALMSTGPKAATFAVMLRILFGASAPGWFWLVWVSAVLSMFLGNLGALVQHNIKRMLAYSSIAHAGYLLVAFAAAPQIGISAAMFYAASYAAMNAGAFIVISHIASHGERYSTLEGYAGLGRRAPALAAVLTVFLLSLIGIPGFGGFFAKFYVFRAALGTNLIGLTILGVINSAIAAYYYLRVIVVMYMKEPTAEEAPLSTPNFSLKLSLAISVAFTIYLGLLPGRVLQYAIESGKTLMPGQ
jgi:NADH-quinone oxidoreductase subunit N